MAKPVPDSTCARPSGRRQTTQLPLMRSLNGRSNPVFSRVSDLFDARPRPLSSLIAALFLLLSRQRPRTLIVAPRQRPSDLCAAHTQHSIKKADGSRRQ
ncbi:MAG: hypothetical protein WCF57_10150 [Pyrinomonadaceae bacterium]